MKEIGREREREIQIDKKREKSLIRAEERCVSCSFTLSNTPLTNVAAALNPLRSKPPSGGM
jgi:hypothetical protein